MEFQAEQKYARISPTKVRPLILQIRSMEIEKVLEILPLVPNKGAAFLAKVVKSAVANAVQKGFSVSDLKFKEIIANEGPRLKRGRPASRGMWHPYIRRTSHIRVVLQTKDRSEENLNNVGKGDIKNGKKSKTSKNSTVKGKEKIKAIDKAKKRSNGSKVNKKIKNINK